MSFRVRCPSGLGCGLQHRIHGFESRPDFQFIYGHGIKAVPLLRPNNRAFIISQLATESNEVPLRRFARGTLFLHAVCQVGQRYGIIRTHRKGERSAVVRK